MDKLEYTMKFEAAKDNAESEEEIIKKVYDALNEKGYNAVNQLVGYFLSGDPSYITSHNNARSLIRRFERDELLEVILVNYLGKENAE